MKRTVFITVQLFTLLFVAAAGPSAGQVTTSLERLEIAFWPEYDKPGVLVMLKGWLPADAHMPTYVPLPMPVGVTPSAVAKRDPSGQLLLAAYTVLDHRFFQEVRIAADTAEIRLEYYEPLTLEGDTRSYVFEWPGIIALGSVSYELQQPTGAQALRVDPSPHSQNVGFDGLTYFAADLGSTQSGDVLSIAFSYTKASPGLTVNTFQPTPSQDSTTPATLPTLEGSTVVVPPEAGSFPWLVVFPVVLIGALIVAWFLHSGPKQ
jgi:hypothetical protein